MSKDDAGDEVLPSSTGATDDTTILPPLTNTGNAYGVDYGAEESTNNYGASNAALTCVPDVNGVNPMSPSNKVWLHGHDDDDSLLHCAKYANNGDVSSLFSLDNKTAELPFKKTRHRR